MASRAPVIGSVRVGLRAQVRVLRFGDLMELYTQHREAMLGCTFV